MDTSAVINHAPAANAPLLPCRAMHLWCAHQWTTFRHLPCAVSIVFNLLPPRRLARANRAAQDQPWQRVWEELFLASKRLRSSMHTDTDCMAPPAKRYVSQQLFFQHVDIIVFRCGTPQQTTACSRLGLARTHQHHAMDHPRTSQASAPCSNVPITCPGSPSAPPAPKRALCRPLGYPQQAAAGEQPGAAASHSRLLAAPSTARSAAIPRMPSCCSNCLVALCDCCAASCCQ